MSLRILMRLALAGAAGAVAIVGVAISTPVRATRLSLSARAGQA